MNLLSIFRPHTEAPKSGEFYCFFHVREHEKFMQPVPHARIAVGLYDSNRDVQFEMSEAHTMPIDDLRRYLDEAAEAGALWDWFVSKDGSIHYYIVRDKDSGLKPLDLLPQLQDFISKYFGMRFQDI